ncbi:alpha-L-rhamnosidase C-terminal domain-containing protein [Maribacter sp. CXY002]|uniref:alpha-L-rhamnosidase-related protein n=1 Tax=Maribacter luteocoastalis TaxID=3407671 RepID=UPI003B66EB43
MKHFLLKYLILIIIFSPVWIQSQNQNIPPRSERWNAQWITGPGTPINSWTASRDASLKEYGVFKFRKKLELEKKPSSFVVLVSGDNRYKLYVNGTLISQGPARGNLYFWNYETVDLAPFLKVGENVVAALVWNDGNVKPEAQITHLTGFILQGYSEKEELINTNETWKTIEDESYQPLQVRVGGYYVAGPGELVDMSKNIQAWEKFDYNDDRWVNARTIGTGNLKQYAVNSSGWMLVPSPIPQMEMTKERLASTRRTSNVDVPNLFPAEKVDFSIPANSEATILLDQGHLTNAYPTLVFSGGKNAQIGMSYAESLFIHTDEDISGPWLPELPKGNRNKVDGKIFIGKKDSILSNGTQKQVYSPLWWRTYRYVQLTVKTQNEPMTINDFYGIFTGYPFTQNASLEINSPEMDQIMEIGWRTARLCAFETYMDCPYYEQLQYIGDARIQALVSYFNSGDDLLARYGLTLMDHSRIPEGITMSRYPTDLDQQIPTFSLWWVAMLHDYYRYRPDAEFIKNKLPGTREVMSFFASYQQVDGSLKNVPYWVFTDWAEGDGWNFGMAPKGENGESAILDLQLLWVYQQAAELEGDLGLKDFQKLYTERAEQLKKTIRKKYWDQGKELFADTADKKFFSQHVNSLAILSGAITGEEATALARNILTDISLVQASIYFKFYLHQALVKAGLGDDYMKWLDKWRENIAMGLTTWAEDSDVSKARSDSHAWGSSPNIEFFRVLLGIDSDAPGFAKVKIEPHLGDIKEIGGQMPHPQGMISVKYNVLKKGLEANITLPNNVTGTFIWLGKPYELKPGTTNLKI